MREHPDGVRLLELAREMLLNELLPAMPSEFSYKARLAANAMAIAARELEVGREPREAERLALESVHNDYQDDLPGMSGTETLDEALQRLTWRLAAEIRAGGRDADPKIFAVLEESARLRLRIVNPRALQGDE